MDGENLKQPKRKSKVTKKEVHNQIQSLLKEALQDRQSDEMRKSASNLHAIESTLEEFLKAFVLLGYDIDGTPITCINAKTQQDADSLSTAVSRFFARHHNNVQQ